MANEFTAIDLLCRRALPRVHGRLPEFLFVAVERLVAIMAESVRRQARKGAVQGREEGGGVGACARSRTCAFTSWSSYPDAKISNKLCQVSKFTRQALREQLGTARGAKERALLESQLATIPADDGYDAVRLWRCYTTEQRRR